MTSDFIYISSRKNDGKPSAYSAEQLAVSRAFNTFYEEGGSNWSQYIVEKLSCDCPEDHWPEACWHYGITITPERKPA